jgi:hypothetical protein
VSDVRRYAPERTYVRFYSTAGDQQVHLALAETGPTFCGLTPRDSIETRDGILICYACPQCALSVPNSWLRALPEATREGGALP